MDTSHFNALPLDQQNDRRRYVVKVLRECGGNLTHAASRLRREGFPFAGRDFIRRARDMEAAGELGVSPAGFSDATQTLDTMTERHAARERAEPTFDLLTPPKRAPDRKFEEDGDKAKVEYTSTRFIRTLEDALEYAEVDREVWRVKKWGCTAWRVSMKLRNFDDRGRVTHEAPHTENLWRVSMDLERILPKPWHDATLAIIERMREHSPTYPKLKIRQQPNDPHMLEVDLSDVHFGKLAWAPETGNNYDLRIAERVYKNAVTDLLNRAAGFEIDRILLPIGNDFFHIDTLTGTTTAGTPQDTEGRYDKIIETGTMALIWAVETLMAVAPVRILRIPGNHDRQTSLHLAREIATWFRHSDAVTVDHTPKARKSILYGKNLISFTHGNEEKHVDLPSILAHEERDLWAQAEYAEIHVGHWHRAKELRTMPLETHGGVGIRFLMSLSGVDAWHYLKGYCTSRRAAECYLWGRAPGLSGHFTAGVREDS